MKNKLDREKTTLRINGLKTENDKARVYLQELDLEKQKTTADILIRNGRILELEEMLKDER